MIRRIVNATCAIAAILIAPHALAQSIVAVVDENAMDINPTALSNTGIDVREVDPDDPNPIQTVIDTLDSNVIELIITARDGGVPWSDSLTIDSIIDVRGFKNSSGQDAVVQATGTNPGIDLLPGASVFLTNLTFNANNGNAIRVDDAGLLVTDCIFNSTGATGFRAINNSIVIADRCQINGNGGAGLRGEDNVDLTVFNTMFIGNNSHGMHLSDAATADIGWCSFINNGGSGVFRQGGASTAIALQRSLVYLNTGIGLHNTGPAANFSVMENYVYNNNGASPAEDTTDGGGNYDGVIADGASSTIFLNVDGDPLNNPNVSTTTGKIQTGPPTSPLIDRTASTPPSGFALDFEEDPRPDSFGGLIEIGADEFFNPVSGTLIWSECEIQARGQGQPNFIGLADANDIDITVVTTQEVADGEIFIVPQGGDPSNPDHRILLTRVYAEGGAMDESRESRWTNIGPIETILDDTPGTIPGEPDAGDLIADGHGAVYIIDGSVILGYPDLHAAANDAQVLGDASRYRHVIIDTIPPRLDICAYDPPERAVGTGDQPVDPTLSNDNETALGPIPSATHPYPTPPGTVPGLGIVWEPATEFVPADDGGIGYSPFATGGQGAAAFFNTSSIANGLAAIDLWATINVRLIDDVVRDAGTNAPITGMEASIAGGTMGPFNARQPGGFGITPGFTTYPGQFSYVINDVPIGIPEIWDFAKWSLASGSDTLANATPVFFTGGLASTDPVTCGVGMFSGYNIADGSTVAIMNVLDATWDFSTMGGGPPGSISFIDEVQNDGYMHLAIEFEGRDQAGNESTFQDDDSLLIEDTLHVWWIVDTLVKISPDRSGARVNIDEASFNMELDRGFDTNVVAQPQPFFSYAIWAADGLGDSAAARTGTFSEVIPWTAWGPNRRIDSSIFEAILPTIDNRWVIVAASVIDEAGNVQPRPSDLPFIGNDIDVGSGNGGQNWQKFFISSDDSLDTSISATFWWDNLPYQQAGNPTARTIDPGEVVVSKNNEIVPSPPSLSRHVEVRFDIGMESPDATARMILFEIVESGDERIGFGKDVFVVPANDFDSVSVTIPAQRTGLAPLEDVSIPVSTRRARHYIVRARVFEDANSSLSHDAGELIDSTPASFSFTVIPESSVSAYIDPKDRAEDQPIRVNRAE